MCPVQVEEHGSGGTGASEFAWRWCSGVFEWQFLGTDSGSKIRAKVWVDGWGKTP